MLDLCPCTNIDWTVAEKNICFNLMRYYESVQNTEIVKWTGSSYHLILISHIFFGKIL